MINTTISNNNLMTCIIGKKVYYVYKTVNDMFYIFDDVYELFKRFNGEGEYGRSIAAFSDSTLIVPFLKNLKKENFIGNVKLTKNDNPRDGFFSGDGIIKEIVDITADLTQVNIELAYPDASTEPNYQSICKKYGDLNEKFYNTLQKLSTLGNLV